MRGLLTFTLIAFAALTPLAALADDVAIEQRPADGDFAKALIRDVGPIVRSFGSYNQSGCGSDVTGRQAMGYGAQGQVSANSRPVLVVQNGSDTVGQPFVKFDGSLRSAVEEADRLGGAVIKFSARTLEQSPITLKAPLFIPSNTMIDGECQNITLQAPPEVMLIAIRNVRDVTIRGLSLRKTSYDPESKSARDVITVAGKFSGIWIDGNRFSRCGDGCIDIVRFEHGRITISHNLFSDHNKTMLFYNAPCTPSSKVVACSQRSFNDDRPAEPKAFVTLFNNVFWGTAQRNPKIGADVYVHAVNNLILYRRYPYSNGRRGTAYGIAAMEGAQLFATDNVVVDLNERPRGSVGIGGSEADPDESEPGRWGYIRQERNVVPGAERLQSRKAELVPLPTYTKLAAAIEISKYDWVNAAGCIARRLMVANC